MSLKFLINLRKMKSQSVEKVLPKAIIVDALTAYLMPFDNKGRDIVDIDMKIPDYVDITIHYKKETKSRTRKD